MAKIVMGAVTGVISAHSIELELLDEFFQNGIDLDYEDYIRENGENAAEDYESNEPLILVGYVKEGENYVEDENADYSLLYRVGSSVIQVTRSKWIKPNCWQCSPCYPGQSDLDTDHGGNMAYCLPLEDISEYAEDKTKNGIIEAKKYLQGETA